MFSEEKGQSLVTIVLLGALLALFAMTLVKMHRGEMITMKETKVKDKLFVVGDAAIQRAMTFVLTSRAVWDNADQYPSFNTLTGTPFTEIEGAEYYIKVKKGTLTLESDIDYDNDSVDDLTPTGDVNIDRTVVVKAVDKITGQYGLFFANLTKTKPDVNPSDYAIYNSGAAELADWDGIIVDSCSSTYVANSEDGTISASDIIGGDEFDLTLVKSDNEPLPPIQLPATTSPFPARAVTDNITGSYTLGPSVGAMGTSKAYQCNDLSLSSDILTINATNGPVEIFVTGKFTISGNSRIIINLGAWTCCVPKSLKIYMVGTNDVVWNGTPDGRFVLMAPTSNVYLNGTGNKIFQGSIISKNINVSGGGAGKFVYDKCLIDPRAHNRYLRPPIIMTRWQQTYYKR